MTMLSQYALVIWAAPPTIGTPLARSTASKVASHTPVAFERMSTWRSAAWNRHSFQNTVRSVTPAVSLACVHGSVVGAAIGPSFGVDLEIGAGVPAVGRVDEVGRVRRVVDLGLERRHQGRRQRAPAVVGVDAQVGPVGDRPAQVELPHPTGLGRGAQQADRPVGEQRQVLDGHVGKAVVEPRPRRPLRVGAVEAQRRAEHADASAHVHDLGVRRLDQHGQHAADDVVPARPVLCHEPSPSYHQSWSSLPVEMSPSRAR